MTHDNYCQQHSSGSADKSNMPVDQPGGTDSRLELALATKPMYEGNQCIVTGFI